MQQTAFLILHIWQQKINPSSPSAWGCSSGKPTQRHLNFPKCWVFYLDWKGKLEASVAQSALDILQYFISSSEPKTKAWRLTFGQRRDSLFLCLIVQRRLEEKSYRSCCFLIELSSADPPFLRRSVLLKAIFFFEVYFLKVLEEVVALRFLVQCLFVRLSVQLGA